MMVDIYQYFKLHPNYNKLIGDDYLIVEYNCPINVEEFELWTEAHLITYVINGRKDWISGSTVYKIKTGDSLFIRKGVYMTKQYLEEEYCVILFFLNDGFIKRFSAENSNVFGKKDPQKNLGQVFPIHTTETFHSLIESIFHYLKEKAPIPRNLVELKFKELLFNIALNPDNKDIVNFFNTVRISTKTNMEDVMMKNFRSDLNMIDFAKLCGRSLSTFKRDFNLLFSTTPSKWIKSKRLDYAKMLLLGTNLNINEICYESGFNNNSHFISAFKTKFHLPPNQFKIKYLAK
jgi:AraC-like DNA-binding protein